MHDRYSDCCSSDACLHPDIAYWMPFKMPGKPFRSKYQLLSLKGMARNSLRTCNHHPQNRLRRLRAIHGPSPRRNRRIRRAWRRRPKRRKYRSLRLPLQGRMGRGRPSPHRSPSPINLSVRILSIRPRPPMPSLPYNLRYIPTSKQPRKPLEGRQRQRSNISQIIPSPLARLPLNAHPHSLRHNLTLRLSHNFRCSTYK